MCGIVGYIGNGTSNTNTKDILLDGLKELEYRGYDSAGIALVGKNTHLYKKEVGKLNNLSKVCSDISNEFNLGIGHTRWATHGKPNQANAHPHFGKNAYVVHNGIIENYKELMQFLSNYGVVFASQTDTEVIAHLFDVFYNELNNSQEAFLKTISKLKGSYSILLCLKNDNSKIFFVKNGSPLNIALTDKSDNKDIYFASSENALIGKSESVAFLNDGDSGVANNDGNIQMFSGKLEFKKLSLTKDYAQKDGYRFFMEKEIFEQRDVIKQTLMGRISDEQIMFEEINESFFDGITNIEFCACGTSYHACLSASYLFARLAKTKAHTHIASEFRYSDSILDTSTLFVVVSQSGETADTIEALKKAKKAGLKTLAICNVDNSSITRLSDAYILTRAGIEKGVASTKAFSSQSVVLWMLALYFAQSKNTISKDDMKCELNALSQVSDALSVKTSEHEKCKRLSKKYLDGHGFFFIGRDVFYPLALEGALKLKEITYLHAEGYPAGEMKHGPIALADSGLYTIALMSKNLLYDKTKSNVAEISARDSNICVISSEIFDLADDFVHTKEYDHYMLDFFAELVVLQLLSLEVAIRLGLDADMPRNLAKSVTVE